MPGVTVTPVNWDAKGLHGPVATKSPVVRTPFEVPISGLRTNQALLARPNVFITVVLLSAVKACELYRASRRGTGE